MKVLRWLSNFVSKWMALFAVLIAALALFQPSTVAWIKTSWINPLLGIIMFGMGLTLKPQDFAEVLKRPKDIFLGFIAQFTIMPFVAWVLTVVFKLPTDLAIGVILVGTCPGGTSSNVMTYLSHGDVALSVSMTACSTIFAPIMTPLLTLLYAGQRVDVNVLGMFLSVIEVVLLPIALGFIVRALLKDRVERVQDVLPLVSTVSILLIIASVVAANSSNILANVGVIFVVVILHNLIGYALGYGIAKVFKCDKQKCRAVSIEVGMQNSGLATSLALTRFAAYPMAAVPGAIFSTWHNISGALLASWFNYRDRKAQENGAQESGNAAAGAVEEAA